MAAFTRRGLRVQPFKVGPDFIDPGFHQAASGRRSRNLDGWMLSRTANLEVFASACTGADLAVIEGVMGLFDGREAAAETGSTAEMAKWLGAPVLLVVDASAIARSAAALVRGFESFDPGLNLSGVLFNRTGGQRHADLLREAVSACCRAVPAGSLPGNEKIGLPSRHLGLTMADEALTNTVLDEMVAWLEKHVDLNALLALAREHSTSLADPPSKPVPRTASKVRIGLARDAAFCFYYEDNLDLLREAGAELVVFSPIADQELPAEIGGLYIGGGYPELHAAKLSENRPMLAAIRQFAQSGAPIYAECGGFMYLTEAIVDGDGREYPMAGLFSTRARMQRRLAALGYLEAEAGADMPWLRAGERLRGHEFRYSEIDGMPVGTRRCLRLHGSHGTREEGYRTASVLAGYAHLHFRSCPEFAARFVQACADLIE
jgi:cobyrinic acid a,c-diamide synthase